MVLQPVKPLLLDETSISVAHMAQLLQEMSRLEHPTVNMASVAAAEIAAAVMFAREARIAIKRYAALQIPRASMREIRCHAFTGVEEAEQAVETSTLAAIMGQFTRAT